MTRKIKARFSHGVIEPLEKIEMPEGKEITIFISEPITKEFINEEEQRSRQWGELATSSFASDWENEKDAIYDRWEEYYRVQKR